MATRGEQTDISGIARLLATFASTVSRWSARAAFTGHNDECGFALHMADTGSDSLDVNR